MNPLPSSRLNTRKFLIFLLLIAISWYIGRIFKTDIQQIKMLILQYPAVSGAVFVFLYVILTFFAWLTKDLFKIVGAVVFGAYLSTLLIWIAEIINASILFNISRHLGRGFVEEKFKGRSKKIDFFIEHSGFWSVFILRSLPIVPYRLLDFVYGLTNIPLKQYLTIAIVASPGRLFFIQFVLAAVGESILDSPDIATLFSTLMIYFQENTTALIIGFAYIIVAILLMLILGKKAKYKNDSSANGYQSCANQ